MAFTHMEFERNWNNAADFPTHEIRESVVRADMQSSFDELKNFLNNMIDAELNAAHLPFSSSAAISKDNVQAAIENLHEQMADIQGGWVLDGSVDATKLANGAVTAAKIANGGITSEKIANGAITSAHLAPGAISGASIASGTITGSNLANSAVDTNNIANNSVTADKLSNDAVITARIKDGAVTTAKIQDLGITEGKIANNAVTTNKINNYSITTAKIADGAVTEAKIADAAVATGKIRNSAVTTEKILDGAVTADKINGTVQKRHTVVGPVTLAASGWSNNEITVTVSGVSLTSAATQSVYNTVDDSSWEEARNCGVRAKRMPPAANKVTFVCSTVPSSSLVYYFDIFD